MTTRNTHLTHPIAVARRRRPARHPELFRPPAEDRTAAAMDDAEQAEQLIADLLALVEAGAIEPLSDPAGSTRYAPRDDDFDTAA